MKKEILKGFLALSIGLSLAILASCGYYAQPRESHPTQARNENWYPHNRFEKECYNDGFKPGTSEFGVCVEKHREGLVWKKKNQEVQMEKKREWREEQAEKNREAQMRRKEGQERAMERRERMREQQMKQKEIAAQKQREIQIEKKKKQYEYKKPYSK